MTKISNRASVREQKAEATDSFVKSELSRTKATSEAKTARLKALRLARDEANTPASQKPAGQTTEGKAVPRKTMHLRRFS